MEVWTLFFAGLGLAMFIEGMPYFVSPRSMRRFLAMVQETSDGALRTVRLLEQSARPTEAGRAYIVDVAEAPAYEGSKNFFLIGDQIDDADWLTELVRQTEHELPRPKPRKRKKK